MFILHTLYLLSGSLTTMSLACSPIASPVSFLLALFLVDCSSTFHTINHCGLNVNYFL
nr:MAG TPA: hypothetical protein [Caudoviricetes sp.]